jgi:hypothetical protein
VDIRWWVRVGKKGIVFLSTYSRRLLGGMYYYFVFVLVGGVIVKRCGCLWGRPLYQLQ